MKAARKESFHLCWPPRSKKILLRMYNDVWTERTLSPVWKHSTILPFLKPKEDDSNSYRPIALTATSCKVMDGMITNRLRWFIEKLNLFSPNQAGFRKGKCTVDHIMRLQNGVQAALNHGHFTVVGVHLDFSKAFDMNDVERRSYRNLTRIEIGGQMGRSRFESAISSPIPSHWITDLRREVD